MPIIEPTLPPMMASTKRVDSGIRQARFMAFLLSTPITMRLATFTAMAYKIRMSKEFMALKQLFALFLHFHGANFAGKTEEIDEAFCIVVIVEIPCGERGDALIVECVR